MADRIDAREELLAALAESLAGWSRPDQALHFGEVGWLPDLLHNDGRLLHLTLDEIEPAWIRRMAAAHEDGRTIAVACTPRTLTLQALKAMQDLEATPLVVDGNDDSIEATEFSSVADLVAMYELFLGQKGLEALANPLLDQALAETSSYRKGLLFEQVLCLLFSQVSYLRVREHRFTNPGEEIDLILGNQATGDLRELLGGPLILVSGKNQATPAGAPEVRALRGNMGNRRGRCSFGILASARDLAETAEREQIHTTTDPTQAVALLDGDRIRQLIASPHLDADLENHLRRAVMD